MLAARQYRSIYLLILCPYLLLFMLFGSYAIRLGGHVTALSAVLISAVGYWPFSSIKSPERTEFLSRRAKVLAYALVIVALVSIGSKAWTSFKKLDPQFAFYDTGKNTIRMYFGDDWQKIYSQVYKGDAVLYIPSAYIYGLFYSHNHIVRPEKHPTYSDVRRQITDLRPQYVFDPGIVGYGSGADRLRELVGECSQWFDTVAGPPNRFGYVVYRLNEGAMDLDPECGT